MKPTLQVRLSQHLALTPQLQQSIRLLQLSTLELHQEVGQMLEQNPFLELDEDTPLTPFDTPPERQAADRVASTEPPEGAEPSGDVGAEPAGDVGAEPAGEAGAEIRADDFGTTARDDWENGTEGDDFDGIRETPAASELAGGAGGAGDGDDFDPQDRRAGAATLAEHLRSQMVGMRLDDEDHAALEVLIESLDGDGYLADTLEEIAQRLADMLGLPHDHGQSGREDLQERLQCALRWLQSMDPCGVGARSLSECLMLQLRQTPRSAARELALRICDKYLEHLARRDIKRLCALTAADEPLVRRAHALIQACEPKPGRPFSRAEENVIVPDVIVRKSGRGFAVALNPDVMPKLRINEMYAHAVRGQRGTGGQPGQPGQPGLSGRVQEARWFIKNILQRFDTILRVSEAIVERQKGFFTHGAIAMKPLVLREIADELGLHESTISRVTTAKYMTTPQGTFELKYFFGSGLGTEAGGSASSTAVRVLIQQFVAAESQRKPLSDSQIAAMLGEQGIQVARRTVAKYREGLRIAPAALRKEI